jgi:hypothetical protein
MIFVSEPIGWNDFIAIFLYVIFSVVSNTFISRFFSSHEKIKICKHLESYLTEVNDSYSKQAEDLNIKYEQELSELTHEAGEA